MISPEIASQSLQSSVMKLDSLLSPWGFEFEADAVKSSHSGPYACGRYRRNTTTMALSCRVSLDNIFYEHSFIEEFPSYRKIERFTIDHDTLMKAMGHADTCKLICTHQQPDAMVARDGGDPVEALVSDLRSIASPVLSEPCDEFYEIMRRGRRVSLVE